MQVQNVAEYKAIREETSGVKNCITTYVGFVVAGSATSFWGLAARVSEKGPERLAMSLMAVLLAITSTLVLFLLSYKFTSHNRYAGYSKLLAHERFRPQCPAEDFSCWEICIDRLRASDKELTGLCDSCGDLKIDALNKLDMDLADQVTPLSGAKPAVDRGWVAGCRLMLWRWREESGAWKFPIYVARIFAAMDLIFVGFGAYFLYTVSGYPYFWPGLAALVLLVVVLGALWMIFASKLAKQMVGSETVEAFCWKFVPIRAEFLRELDQDIGYDLAGVSRTKVGHSPAQAANV